jgi:hypothetical protein
MSVLSPSDVEQFVELGWCQVKDAFARVDAAAAVDELWQRITAVRGIARDRPDSWPEVCDLEERLDTASAQRCFSDRLADAIEQLVGAGRWTGSRQWGFWPVHFYSAAHALGAVPPYGWHVDGNWFTHTLDCPRQGLLVIGLFTDLDPGGGGTVLAERSHRRTSRILAASPDGLSHGQLFDRVLAEPLGGFHEIIGSAGDAILAHPFLFHTRGYKRGGSPRVISNTEAPLREPMQWTRPSSPLEYAIARALVETDPLPPDAMWCRF